VDQVDVGVTIAPQLVPDPWTIIDGLDSALREYLRLAKKKKIARRPAKKSPRRTVKKSASKRKSR
jgi:hypothetical protein